MAVKIVSFVPCNAFLGLQPPTPILGFVLSMVGFWGVWGTQISNNASVPIFPNLFVFFAGSVVPLAMFLPQLTVCFRMSAQVACLRRGIVTLVAFAKLFSTACFQMSPQSACIIGCIVTLVAFV